MSHYYDAEQASPLRKEKIVFTVKNRQFVFTTGSGTFSKHELDKATKLLIETTPIQGTESLLDLGCGWGAVGIILKTCHPDLQVIMCDINERAVQLARDNKKNLDIDIRISDVFSKIPETFDTILTNPPYAAGREVCYQFIDESYHHLNPKGSFYLVARHQKGGKMLEKHIEETFGNVETLAKKGGFRIYKGTK